MTDSFYSRDELSRLGLADHGKDVRISRKASLYNPARIRCGSHVRIDDFAVLTAGDEGIELGSYVHIACFCALHGSSGIVMKDFTGLSARSVLYSESDDFTGESLTFPFFPLRFKPGYRKGRIVLDRHSIVGTNCTIMPGVVLAEGAAIGAHALVVDSCAAWTIYAGVPAKAIRPRSRTMLRLEQEYLAGIASGDA